MITFRFDKVDKSKRADVVELSENIAAATVEFLKNNTIKKIAVGVTGNKVNFKREVKLK